MPEVKASHAAAEYAPPYLYAVVVATAVYPIRADVLIVSNSS